MPSSCTGTPDRLEGRGVEHAQLALRAHDGDRRVVGTEVHRGVRRRPAWSRARPRHSAGSQTLRNPLPTLAARVPSGVPGGALVEAPLADRSAPSALGHVEEAQPMPNHEMTYRPPGAGACVPLDDAWARPRCEEPARDPWRSQTRIARSSPALYRVVSSGPKAMATAPSPSRSRSRTPPVATSQMMAVRSQDDDASDLPSWEKRRDLTRSSWPRSTCRIRPEAASSRSSRSGGSVTARSVPAGSSSKKLLAVLRTPKLPTGARASRAGGRCPRRTPTTACSRTPSDRPGSARPCSSGTTRPRARQLHPHRERRRVGVVASSHTSSSVATGRPVTALSLQSLDRGGHCAAVRAEAEVDDAKRS